MRIRTALMAAVMAAAACVALPVSAGAAPPAAAPAVLDSIGSAVRTSGLFHGSSLKAVGLADGGKSLVGLATNRPEQAWKIGSVSGLSGDSFLVGIDYRVQNGKLYGVGNQGGIYTVSERNAKAAKVGQLSVALSGTSFGVDFNPAANALRIVSDNGQNLRQPFATTDGPTAPTVADSSLTYPPAPATGITAAAYTNNDLSPDTATTLFDLDTVLDQIAIQSPANAGTLAPTGKLGADAALDAGFDIYSTVRKDKAVALTAFATIGVAGTYALYEIDLLTGSADKQGSFKTPVTDIAIPLGQR